MQRLNKIIAWIGLTALALPAMAQEKHAFSIQQALDYAKKNNVQVKNALLGIQLQQQQNREITAAAYPQINGSIGATYNPYVATQVLPNFISPSVNAISHAFSVQAIIQNEKDHPLSPGMFVHVTQEISIAKNALLIPDEAVQADVKGYYVYKIIGNKATQVYVTLGTRADNKVQILSGLSSKDKIVIAGQQKLTDGMLVKVV